MKTVNPAASAVGTGTRVRVGETRRRGPSLRAVRDGVRTQRHKISLSETLDRVLNKGAIVMGDITISVADVDLVYLGVSLVLASVDTMRDWQVPPEVGDAEAPADQQAGGL